MPNLTDEQTDTKQTTFGRVSVVSLPDENLGSDRRCDKCIDPSGPIPKRCAFDAVIGVLRPPNEIPEFYCRTHAQDTWLDMAGVSDSQTTKSLANEDRTGSQTQ